MHPLWETRDVVLEVVSLLPKADQARIARVNTALWEIAIPWIWRDVPNIRYIFQLLPLDLWNETIDPLTPAPKPPRSRELQDSDWSRFLFHSNNTRTTTYTTGDLRKIVPPQIWSHRLFSTSFPNLRRLFVTILDSVSEGPIDIVPLLLRSSLRSIEFWVEEPSSESILFSALGTITQNKTLSIEDMGFKFVRNVGASSGAIAQAIASQTSLRRLELNGYTDVAHLAGSATELPLLEELEVHGMFAEVPEINYTDLSFRSLRTLIAVGRPEMIHSLLRCIGSDRLAKVALTFTSWRSEMQIHPELMAELQRFRPHLAHLQLTVDMKLLWGALEPVLALAELQAFHLEYLQFGSDLITDDQLGHMIDAWPNLTQLRLEVSPPRVTLASIACIGTHCPNLRKLALTFDARKTSNSLAPREVDTSHSSENALELLDVMESEFDEGDEERLSNILRSWWPKAHLCRSDGDLRTSVHWDIDEAPHWPGATESPSSPETSVN
ncbi:hypothetical protein FS837_004268 [Tulasnella sp. UAMH 9824]|nr:hypothetical protein FS837_004268 [Tulasnella sp. UAMH 9824]